MRALSVMALLICVPLSVSTRAVSGDTPPASSGTTSTAGVSPAEQQLSVERLVRRKLGQLNSEEQAGLNQKLTNRAELIKSDLNTSAKAVEASSKSRRPNDTNQEKYCPIPHVRVSQRTTLVMMPVLSEITLVPPSFALRTSRWWECRIV